MEMRPHDLVVVPFHEGPAIDGFDCGNEELNEFLTTEEVATYEAQNFGKTYLVFLSKEWELVAYYTTSSDRLEIPDDWIHKSMANSLGIKQIPGMLIGRLAVASAWQGRGVGSIVLKHVFTEALRATQAIRVIRLTAYHDSVDWYLFRGFQFVSAKEERKRHDPVAKPRLFFDLNALKDVDLDVRIPYATT